MSNTQVTANIQTPRSHRPYVIGVMIVAGGWVLGAGVFAEMSRRTVTPMQRVLVPGRAELTFTESGRHTFFYEYISHVNGQKYVMSESSWPLLDSTLRPKSSGQAVEVHNHWSREFAFDTNVAWNTASYFTKSYNTAPGTLGYAGKSMFEVNIDQPGDYVLEAKFQAYMVKSHADNIERSLLRDGANSVEIVTSGEARGSDSRAQLTPNYGQDGQIVLAIAPASSERLFAIGLLAMPTLGVLGSVIGGAIIFFAWRRRDHNRA